jgi:hypothetical protein
MPLRGTGGFRHGFTVNHQAGRDSAILPEPTSSHENCLKTRHASQAPSRPCCSPKGGVGCTSDCRCSDAALRGCVRRVSILRSITTGAKFFILRFPKCVSQIELAGKIIETSSRAIYNLGKNRAIGVQKYKFMTRLIKSNPSILC